MLLPENLLVDLSNFCQFSVSAEAVGVYVCVRACVHVCMETKMNNEVTNEQFTIDNVLITSQTIL